MSTSSDTPAVSVVLPVYNGERFLAAALASMLAQTFRDFELLVLDDGSRDGSRAIAEGFGRGDPRVRVLSGPNQGVARTLNKGLDSARAPLVARMDADDVAFPDRLERQVAYLSANPDVIVLGSGVVLTDSDGDALANAPPVPPDHDGIDAAHLHGEAALWHPTVTYRTEVVRALGGYRVDFDMAEDLDLWLRLAERGRLANLPTPLLYYRQHLSSVGVQKRMAQRAVADRARAEAWGRRGLAGSAPAATMLQPADPTALVRNWAWWALGSGHVRTARKHALDAVRRSPFALDTWRLVYCAVRGR